jgi:hypothetical protein
MLKRHLELIFGNVETSFIIFNAVKICCFHAKVKLEKQEILHCRISAVSFGASNLQLIAQENITTDALEFSSVGPVGKLLT